jgi:uncharacterized protein (DUF342 family)
MENIIYSPSGRVSIRINDDKMSAWMYIHKSIEMIDENEILEIIKDAGICNGFDEAQEWMSTNGYNKDFEKPFPIAICKTALNKEELTYKFDTVNTYNPQRDWNIREILKWTYIEKGTNLAELSLNLFNDGGSVYNIFGELTSDVASAFPLSDYLGNNVSLDTDNRKLIAEVSGYPYLDNENRINVTNHLDYKGDIVMTKLPNTIMTSLTIDGSISKSHISIGGNLLVKGNIVGSDVVSDGNVFVEGSIIDCQSNGVVVSQDLHVKSISSSLVLCKGQISFETTINNSRVVAEKMILGDPELSLIKGSQVLTGGTIDIADAGDEEGNEAELESTISPFTKERIRQINKLIAGLMENVEVNKDKIEALNYKKQNLEEELAVELEEYLNNPSTFPKCIKIRNGLFKGVYLRVMKDSWQIKTTQSNVEYNCD